MIRKIRSVYDKVVKKFRCLDFIVLLAIRLYLIPIFFVGARSKILGFGGTVTFFGNAPADGGLGLPFPELMAGLATSAEVLGVICLALGLFTRLMSIPLIITMLMAIITVHWKHGWDAIASKHAESTMRLHDLMHWLGELFPGRYNYITELGDPVILQNGIEYTTTYIIMLSVLVFYGGGRYMSLDYWLKRFTR